MTISSDKTLVCEKIFLLVALTAFTMITQSSQAIGSSRILAWNIRKSTITKQEDGQFLSVKKSFFSAPNYGG